MKNFIFGFLFGGAIAGGVTFFVTKRMVEDKCQKDINEIKASYKKESGSDDKKEKDNEESKKVHENIIPDKPIPKEYKNLTSTYTADADEREVLDDDGDDGDDGDGPLVTSVDMTKTEDMEDYEYISVDEYGELNTYKQTNLEYYTEDNMICYEGGAFIDDLKYLVGDLFDKSDWQENDDIADPLYIRNNRISEEFEITKIFAKYGDIY